MAIDVPLALTPRGPAGPAPARRPGSVRRTTTIDMRWPAGRGTQLRLTGRARDLLTPRDPDAAPVVLDRAAMVVGVHPHTRTIEEIATTPERPGAQSLVGVRGLRATLADALPGDARDGTALYLLLDDIAACTLIAGFSVLQWIPIPQLTVERAGRPRPSMEGICTGFQSGSSGLLPDGSSAYGQRVRVVGPLAPPEDPAGWHPVDDVTDMSMRRARRVDVTRVDDTITIDATFQDSSTTPRDGEHGGARVAVHEYVLRATADARTGLLTALSADPRVLPYHECPLASATVDRIVGAPLHSLRTEVPRVFPRTAGCTHLNDAMRALAEVPALARALPETDPGRSADPSVPSGGTTPSD